MARRLGLEIVFDRDLREIDVGSREGRTWIEIDDQGEWDGEPLEAHADRVLRALRRAARAHDGGRILVVTHGGSVRRVHEHIGLEIARMRTARPGPVPWSTMPSGRSVDVTDLLLVRHGETDWNAEGRLQGHTDRPLSDYGRGQARRLAGELEGEELEAIYSSDLARARETAEIVGERLGLPVVLDPDLREKDWGNWEGLTAVERDRVEFVGESTEAHAERMLRALRRIAERHPVGRVLVVTHGGSMRRVQTAALGMALPVVENCGRWLCAWDNGSLRAR